MATLTVLGGAQPMDRAAPSAAGATAIAEGCMVTAHSAEGVAVPEAEAGFLMVAAVTTAESEGTLAPPVW